jgi:hypothetical protein
MKASALRDIAGVATLLVIVFGAFWAAGLIHPF